jgi:predicted amidohydrolase YtcJ
MDLLAVRPGSLVLALALWVAGPVAAQTPAAASRAAAPTLLLTSGKVFTADSTRPWAEAIAIRGDRIVAVGTTAEVRRLAGHGTREIALGGRVVIPGINDAHDHVGAVPLGGEFHTSASPTPDPTFGQVLDSVRALGARTPAGLWLHTAIGVRVLDDTAARRAALDRVAAGHPVILGSWWGHGAVLNTAALHLLGIADTASDPLGGWYERDQSGGLTGRLDEYARWAAERRLYSGLPERVLVTSLQAFADSALRLGVTTVQDMTSDLTPALTVRVLRTARLPIRMRLIRWSVPNSAGRNEAEWDAATIRPAPRVVVSGRKWVLDGTPIERNALRRAAYASPPGSHGRLNFPADTIRMMLAAALRPGAAQLHLHVVGDSTAALVLSAMEALGPDSVWRARRVRFEHAPGLVGPLIERAHRLGIVIAQPRAGAPLRTWRAAGIPLAYGSDGLRNPFYNLMVAVSGRGGDPTEALTREQAVTMYTRGSAYAAFAEREQGTLAPGMLADLAVLSQDIFTIPAAALPGTISVLTLVGGRIARDELTNANRARAPGGAEPAGARAGRP